MIFLFGGGKKDMVVITKSLYDQAKGDALYQLKQKFGQDGGKIYATFQTIEPFITDMPLGEKEKEEATKLARVLGISGEEAEGLFLAKKLGCKLIISSKQVWLANAANKQGVKTQVFL